MMVGFQSISDLGTRSNVDIWLEQGRLIDLFGERVIHDSGLGIDPRVRQLIESNEWSLPLDRILPFHFWANGSRLPPHPIGLDSVAASRSSLIGMEQPTRQPSSKRYKTGAHLGFVRRFIALSTVQTNPCTG